MNKSDEAAQGLRSVRPIVACVLVLLAEYLAVSLRYDASTLRVDSEMVSALRHAGAVAPLAVLVAAVALALFRGRLVQAWRVVAVGGVRLAAPWLLVHGAAFAGFLVLTDRLFGGVVGDSALVLGAAWTLAGGLVAVTLPLIAMTPQALWVFARAVLPVLGNATVVAAAAWLAGLASLHLWDQLSAVTLYSVAFIFQWLVDDLVFDPVTAEVGSQRFFVTVAPICSGYEGLGLIVVFLGAYVWIARDALRLPQALMLIPIGLAAVWMGNVVRIVALVLVGLYVSPATALGGFHSKAGWVFFCAIGLALVAWSQRSPWLAKHPREEDARPNPVAPYLVPLLAVIAGGLATGLVATHVDRGYGVRIVLGALCLYAFRSRLRIDDAFVVTVEAVAVGVLVLVLWLALTPAADAQALAQSQQSFAALSSGERASWIFFKLVGSVIVIPIVEERAFRGYLLRRLDGADFEAVSWTQRSPVALLGSSLAFGFLHQQWIAGTVAGLLYALLQTRRGRLGEAVMAHAVTNACIAALVLGAGRWDLWM